MNDFDHFVAGLDDLEEVGTDRLRDRVRRDGVCMWLRTAVDGPEWSGDDRADRETAARYCAECPVTGECTELEFRTAGLATSGVWGFLPEDERRTAYLAWLSRREGGQR